MNKISFLLILWIVSLPPATSAEFSGDLSVEWKNFIFPPRPENPEQALDNFSIAIQPEFYHSWDDDQQSISIEVFSRIDESDKQRSHNDVREFSWLKVFQNWEIKAGISKVYWGVTESQHLVDVINQTDFVENLDGEEKLGQAMLQASIESNWGTWDFFILPGFRERTFSGIQGRPRFSPRVDTSQTTYESNNKDQNIDLAFRWFHIINDWEIGLSHFSGTSREPVFSLASQNSQAVLIPKYLLMQQTGLDIQATTEDWLWKLELINRIWLQENFTAATAGFEYSFIGVYESDADIGLVWEYLYDSRGQSATTFFQNDMMTGLRLALNDEQSTEALLGIIIDIDQHESFISLEASRRLGEAWKAEFEIRSFQHVSQSSLMRSLKNDDYIQISIAYYF